MLARRNTVKDVVGKGKIHVMSECNVLKWGPMVKRSPRAPLPNKVRNEKNNVSKWRTRTYDIDKETL